MNERAPRATLLVVDDEKHQRESLQMILEDEGYRVTAAADDRQALSLAAETHPEVVLTDLKMPGMSGMELVRALADGPLPPRGRGVDPLAAELWRAGDGYDVVAERLLAIRAAGVPLKVVSERLGHSRITSR